MNKLLKMLKELFYKKEKEEIGCVACDGIDCNKCPLKKKG